MASCPANACSSSVSIRSSSASIDRPIVVHHRVDDAVQQRDRAFGQQALVAAARLAQLADRARVPSCTVTRQLAEEEVDVAGAQNLHRLVATSMPCRTR